MLINKVLPGDDIIVTRGVLFKGEILVACFVSGAEGTEEIHVLHFNSSCALKNIG